MKQLYTIAIALAVLASGCAGSGENRSFTSVYAAKGGIFIRSGALKPGPEGDTDRILRMDEIFYETSEGRTSLPAEITEGEKRVPGEPLNIRATTAEGRRLTVDVIPQGNDFEIRMQAEPDDGIVKWGFSISAAGDEYFTGLMERVVDGPQHASWAPGIQEAMDLRGQRVEMIVKPTTSVYAPFYISSKGYACFVKGTWPGIYDFCAEDPERVKVEFEGPSLELKIYTADSPAGLVASHALDAGPPFLPPRWAYLHWRWRDEHVQLDRYYDGSPVTGPFNSQVMEDILMMDAFGIPCGVYWVDRPYGPGRLGYDDFEIDPERLPHFAEMVRWLNDRQMRMLLWIAPFFQGKMEEEALAQGYTLAGQQPQPNNYPMVDLTNPEAKAYWQAGVEKLLNLGVAAFKLDRGEEGIPESGPYQVFDGRSIRENRNAYPGMYVQAAYEIVKKHRGDDFVLMPRGAYTGSSPYGVFWGGDIGGTQEGLRASIIAVQRAAVMGYPNWGSDTCGYNQQLMEQEVCARWLAFSCFTPIMEVGPTRNLAFWSLPRDPSYDTELIAVWRLYARLHTRLADYSYRHAEEAHRRGTPIVRPLFLADPEAPEAWSLWQNYLYGPDLLVAPVWEKGQRTQKVYFPEGDRWRDAWRPDQVYEGGTSSDVPAEMHQIPIFIREGSGLELGDLNLEYREALEAARQKPDLARLDSELKAWFEGEGAGN